MTDGTAMKGKRIIIPFLLQRQILQQVHSTHIGMEKTMLSVHESVYWINKKTLKTL